MWGVGSYLVWMSLVRKRQQRGLTRSERIQCIRQHAGFQFSRSAGIGMQWEIWLGYVVAYETVARHCRKCKHHRGCSESKREECCTLSKRRPCNRYLFSVCLCCVGQHNGVGSCVKDVMEEATENSLKDSEFKFVNKSDKTVLGEQSSLSSGAASVS